MLLALPVAVFAFGGSELVGLAADADEPARVVKGLLFRITTIHVGVTLALLVVIPWRGVAVASSPFVAFQGHFGLPGAARRHGDRAPVRSAVPATLASTARPGSWPRWRKKGWRRFGSAGGSGKALRVLP